ncbi:hypothetical protein K0P33_21180 [Pseudomonas sp. ArH3a]|uniref:hypothetical protein n=1 Tax=Pseudomonas sp. ArH3a TaxID=2862945 RepID=UPI001F5A0D29|nr:hypothetical protein [Pseudomonas sp. ArH3a]UNM18055.1 hypothetical protein K0P33_21180 [Pseudomonas sp. ArH3a]
MESDKTASIQITFTTGHRNLPYATDLEGGHHPMIWLSKEPDRINEIPELEGEPELKDLIRAINGPGQDFETFRCAHTTKKTEAGITRSMYVAIIFRNRQWAEVPDPYLIVSRNIVTSLARSDQFPDGAIPFELRLRNHWLKEEQVYAYTADIQFYIQAPDEAQMREELARQTVFLEKILNHP